MLFDLITYKDDDLILEKVDEYTLFCHYLGFKPQLRTAYKSPLRVDGDADKSPSFSIFYTNKFDRELFFKDSGTGKSGDVFRMLSIMYGLKLKDVYRMIDQDLKLGIFKKSKNRKYSKVKSIPILDNQEERFITFKTRKWETRDFIYWGEFGVNKDILLNPKYRIFPITHFRSTKNQRIPYTADKLSYAYRVRDKTKIYQPFSKLRKFRTDFNERCLEGFAQLQFNRPELIITKSYKDVLMFRSLGYEAVSARSENIIIPEPFLKFFEGKYNRIITFFDNDGKEMSYKYPNDYEDVKIPKNFGVKDPTDFRKKFGEYATLELLKKLIKC